MRVSMCCSHAHVGLQGGDEDADIAAAIAASLADHNAGRSSLVSGPSSSVAGPSNLQAVSGQRLATGGSRLGEPAQKRMCSMGGTPSAHSARHAQVSASASASAQALAADAAAAQAFVTLRDDRLGVCQLAVKLPDNQRLSDSFGHAQPVSDVLDWLAAHGWSREKHSLCLAHPRLALDDANVSLQDAGVTGKREMLILEERR